MGKKGSWFSAIKKVFSSGSKAKPPSGSEKKSTKEKKKGRGILKHGENKSFIPIFREPSSIEKILGEVDQQKLFVRPPTSSELSITPPALSLGPTSPRVASPRVPSPRALSPKVVSLTTSFQRVASPPRASSQRVASPKAPPPRAASPTTSFQRVSSPPRASSQRVALPKAPARRAVSPRTTTSAVAKNRREVDSVVRPEPTLRNQHLSATKIQTAYRGYMARRSFRALRGLVRLQGVVGGQNVKRQTINAMKQMQLLVRVQTQIQSRRIEMLENQALQRQAHRNDKELESTMSRWTLNQMSEAGSEDWDDSLLTKEEVEARLQKKVEAVVKRERAMAYAYSHKLSKGNAKSALDFCANGFPWWWNWLERQLPPENPQERQAAAKSVQLTPPRAVPEHKPSPRPQATPSPRAQASNYRHQTSTFDNHETVTPRSSKSTVPARAKQFHTPRPRASATDSTLDVPMNDTDSLTSCPPFSVPNYMVPTVSAKAKVRANSNPKERFPGTPGNDSKRRFSFPLTPNISSFKWNKGSNKDITTPPHKVLEKHESMRSVGEVSVDSTVSMPAIVGRKPFNRFV